MTSDDIFDVALAAGDACANAVEHGHFENRMFTVRCEYRAGAMSVEIRDYDTGERWSSEAKTQRMVLPKNAGGLGLVRRAADRVNEQETARVEAPGQAAASVRSDDRGSMPL